MDNIAQDLRLSKLNQGNLRSMLEELRDRAFSEWKKLENYLDSSRSLSQSIFKQLVEREKEIISREKQLEAKEIQFKKEFESRLKKWHGIEKMSEELLDEIKAKKEHLESFNSLVKKSSKELQVTEEQYNAIQISIKEKEKEYDCIEQSISRGHERLVLLEESLQLKLKESQEMWKEFEDVTEMKERCMKELDLKEEQLKVLQESINECEQKIRSEGEKLKSIQNLIVNRSHELKLKEKQLLIIRKLKENNRHSLKRSVDQLADEFEMKKREFESSIELKGKVLESKIEELDLVDRKVKECLEEIVKKGKNFASLRRLVEERFGELELKEREFERRVNEFKLSQNEFESIRKSAELGFKEKTNILHPVIKIEQLEETHTSSASHQSCMTKGKDLLGLLNQRLKKHDLVCSEIFAVLQASSDHAKLVLKAMQRIYHLHLNSNDKEFDETILSGILLSELLMKASPNIDSHVRQEASKLASDWQANMKVPSNNCLEVLVFLQFLVSFTLTSAFDVNELHSLLDVVGLNGQASKLLPAICTVDKTPDVVESIQNLIQRGEMIHAVKHICELKLTDKFSPATLLAEYLEDTQNTTTMICKGRRSNETKKKAMDKEVAVLKAVMECIKDCNLQSGFPIPFYNINQRLLVLENTVQLIGINVKQSRKRRKENSVA